MPAVRDSESFREDARGYGKAAAIRLREAMARQVDRRYGEHNLD